MKQHFLKLFGYDYYANAIMLKAILQAGSPDIAVKLMGHLLAAQQVWLARCMQDPDMPVSPLWPDWKADEQLIINHQNNKDWVNFLESKSDATLNTFFTYTNQLGNTYNNSMIDVITHLINHGTHHRAQAGQALKNNGYGPLPNTDYIGYIRNK